MALLLLLLSLANNSRSLLSHRCCARKAAPGTPVSYIFEQSPKYHVYRLQLCTAVELVL
jgi:hypothetical protein